MDIRVTHMYPCHRLVSLCVCAAHVCTAHSDVIPPCSLCVLSAHHRSYPLSTPCSIVSGWSAILLCDSWKQVHMKHFVRGLFWEWQCNLLSYLDRDFYISWLVDLTVQHSLCEDLSYRDILVIVILVKHSSCLHMMSIDLYWINRVVKYIDAFIMS